MKAKIFSDQGSHKGDVELSDAVFNVEGHDALLHQVVTSYLANQRQGTSKTKTRAEASGGGTKPWKQKGTGRARAGSNTSPVWVRGGKAHGPSPRDYYSTIPPKMKRLALKSALSSRARDSKVVVVDKIVCDSPKTKSIVGLLKSLSLLGKKNLLIIDKNEKNVYLSGRNVKGLEIRPYSQLCAYDVLNSENIVFGSQDIVKKVEEAVQR